MAEALANAATMVRLSWNADRWRSIGALLSVTLLPLSGSMRTVGVAVVADGVVTGRSSRAVAGVAVIAALSGLGHLLEWASLVLRMRLRENTVLYLDQRVMELVGSLPGLEHHERPDYSDHIELLKRHRGSLVNPFMPIPWTLACLVQLVATVVLLGRLHPVLWALPLAAIPSLLASIRIERRWRALWTDNAERHRLLSHLFELGTTPRAAKEVRLFGLAGELDRRHRATFDVVEAQRRGVSVRAAVYKGLGWAVFAMGYMAAVVLVVGRAVDGDLSVGDAVLVLGLGGQVNGQVSELVYLTSWWARTMEAIAHYRWLVDRAGEAAAAEAAVERVAVPARLTSGITFAGVDFAYPATDAPVLSKVDLHLPAGTVVAVVGENGAGKTTLVKLLLRFYDPTAGRITVDGTDLRCFGAGEWRSRASASFQDFARLQLVCRRAVGVGLLPRLDDEPAVVGALGRGGGADLPGGLPNGLDTQLGPEFDAGVDLSTGQWQKVALSRAMMREDPLLLVLDEPTAGLDATTEHALFERFAGQARRAASETGAITVLVSHRFSTVRMADLILVVAGGRVTEVGTHRELVDLDGHYAELYRLQARSYT
ncbi:MAG TPA: ABC transporter ATP-binding protein [Acidimicrobiales bacterium]|nr:ABC transporter ATP-binding protein [Acidimicrobiales bacterium]